MRKIDKLVLRSFLGLFVLTFCIGFFVLLMQFFLFRLEEIIGKGVGWGIYLQVSSYVAIIATRQAFPLAILLASIMAMGNLGQHQELTALKSAGISLPRVLLPLFVFVLLLSSFVLFSNSYLVPHANLNALSLLSDLGTKKPSLAIKEGVFYDGIPGYSIKIRKKLEDKKSLQGIMIYDHTQKKGNVSLTTAESGKLYTIRDGSYMVLELFDGHSYIEEPSLQNNNAGKVDGPRLPLYRSSFKTQKLILSLASFQISRTKEELAASFYKMKDASQLATAISNNREEIEAKRQELQQAALGDVVDMDGLDPKTVATMQKALPKANILGLKDYAKQQKTQEAQQIGNKLPESSSPLYEQEELDSIYDDALEQARGFKRNLALKAREARFLENHIRRYDLERHQMIAWAAACIVVFLAGAPLGAIIKRGGIGLPVLIAAALIVWHYIFEMLGEKWAIAGVVNTFWGAWLANLLLLPFGVFFSIQAYRDARLLEADFYAVLLVRIKKYTIKMRSLWRRSNN